MMYRVRWEIDLDAETPEGAARIALEMQRDPASVATVFDVRDDGGRVTTIDLEGEPVADIALGADGVIRTR